jgi:hypothetical protein
VDVAIGCVMEDVELHRAPEELTHGQTLADIEDRYRIAISSCWGGPGTSTTGVVCTASGSTTFTWSLIAVGGRAEVIPRRSLHIGGSCCGHDGRLNDGD